MECILKSFNVFLLKKWINLKNLNVQKASIKLYIQEGRWFNPICLQTRIHCTNHYIFLALQSVKKLKLTHFSGRQFCGL